MTSNRQTVFNNIIINIINTNKPKIFKYGDDNSFFIANLFGVFESVSPFEAKTTSINILSCTNIMKTIIFAYHSQQSKKKIKR